MYWPIIETSGKSEESSPFIDGSDVLGISARLEESSSGPKRVDLLVAVSKFVRTVSLEMNGKYAGRSISVYDLGRTYMMV